MDPYYEQRLRDEVIYLHSLWHQGPPNRRYPNNPIPIPHHHYNPNYPIAESATTKRKSRNEIEAPASYKKPPQPDPRWETPQPDWPEPPPGWPSSPAKLNFAHPPSEEEQLRHHALRLHNRALEACGGANAGSGSGGSDSEEEEEEEDDDGDDVYKLWLDLFVEDMELRSYYEGNWDGGEFYCLVCGGLGKTKRIKGCAGLVQHAVSISKTRKKRAHRAFAQVVCRVLGWDFGRLPIVVLKGERLSFYLANPGIEQGESREGVKGNVGGERDASGAASGKKEIVICQNCMKDVDANKYKETLNKGHIEPVLNADQLDSELKDNVAVENDATARSSEKEAFDDHQCNDKDQMIFQSSLKNDGTDESRESPDEGRLELLKEPIQEEAKDALSEPEVCAGSIRITTTNAGNSQLPYPITAQEGLTTKRKTRTEIELPSSNKKPPQLDPCRETPGVVLNSYSSFQWPPTGWPSNPVKPSLTQLSEEEQLKHHSLRLHNRALETCSGFFGGNAESGSGSESEEEEDDCRIGDEENDEVYKFWLNLFVDERELRSFYEGNWDSGDFYCLVCGVLGKMKKIKGCTGLLQHAVSISKTKKKRAHRVFAQVVCRVLGWDFGQLPIVVLKGERLSFYLAKAGDEQGEPEVNAGSSEGASGVKDNVTCNSTGSHDEGNMVSIKEENQEEIKDASGEPEVRAGSCDGVSGGVEDNVAAETDSGAELCVKEVVSVQNLLKDDGTAENTETHNEDSLEVEANKGDEGDTGVKVEENADGYKHDLVVYKQNLDTVSGRSVQILTEDHVVALGDGTPVACELQGEAEENVGSPNSDLNVFLENLEPL